MLFTIHSSLCRSVAISYGSLPSIAVAEAVDPRPQDSASLRQVSRLQALQFCGVYAPGPSTPVYAAGDAERVSLLRLHDDLLQAL